MLLSKHKEFKLLDLHSGQSLESKMDLLDVINTCKEMMLIQMSKLCVKVSLGLKLLTHLSIKFSEIGILLEMQSKKNLKINLKDGVYG